MPAPPVLDPTEPLISDPWAPFSHKRAMRNVGDFSTYAPWYQADARRLTAYRIAQDYIDNQARQHLDSTDPAVVDGHREYGDAALVVNTALAALLGDEQSIAVPGADDYDEDMPAPSASDSETTAEQWAANEEALAALNRQEWLREWAGTARLWLKVTSNERKAIGLGDAVYVLGWNTRKARVDVKTYDPGSYFPDLDTVETGDDDWPTRVHVAFTIEPVHEGESRRLRRITWELVPIPPASQTVVNDDGKLDRETLFTESGGDFTPVLTEGDRLDSQLGRIVRHYPWLPDGEFSDVTCIMTDAEWDLGDVSGTSVYDLSYEKATFRTTPDGEVIRRLDCRFDFIPVVHLPNTIAEEEHYGRCVIGSVLQILDDLAATDTDLSKAAATTGSPPISLSGAKLDRKARRTYGPGEVFEVGENGKMDVLDTSRSLDALLKLLEALFARLSVNSRIPESVLGRIKPSEVPSGIALALSFGPLQSMVREMRQIRDEKYPVMLRFVQRIAMVGKDRKGQPGLPAGPVHAAAITFGSYLPADKAAAVQQVVELLNAKAIDRLTAARWLIEAGFSIVDAVELVVAVEHEDFDGAVRLFEALGSTEAVQEYLGRKHAPDAHDHPVDASNLPPADLSGGQRGTSTVPAATGTQ